MLARAQGFVQINTAPVTQKLAQARLMRLHGHAQARRYVHASTQAYSMYRAQTLEDCSLCRQRGEVGTKIVALANLAVRLTACNGSIHH